MSGLRVMRGGKRVDIDGVNGLLPQDILRITDKTVSGVPGVVTRYSAGLLELVTIRDGSARELRLSGTQLRVEGSGLRFDDSLEAHTVQEYAPWSQMYIEIDAQLAALTRLTVKRGGQEIQIRNASQALRGDRIDLGGAEYACLGFSDGWLDMIKRDASGSFTRYSVPGTRISENDIAEGIDRYELRPGGKPESDEVLREIWGKENE